MIAPMTNIPQGVTAAVMPSNTGLAQPLGLTANVPMPANVPPTGLIGSEQALTQGYDAANTALNTGFGDANARLLEYRKAMNNRTLNLDTSVGADVTGAINKGVAEFDPYSKGGGAAQKLYDDYLGVNGTEAQNAAVAAYQDSPILKRQIDQMSKVVERSAAARGGLMSGSVMKELQANAQGLTSQDYFKNLGAIGESANRGLTAASGAANLRSQEAGIAGNLRATGLQAQAQYEMQKEQTRADIAGKLSGLAESHSLNIANLNTGYKGAVAAGRENAGYALGKTATDAATNISNLLNQQGVGMSDMVSKDISNITDFLYQSGMQDAVDAKNLAALIANINGGQASQLMEGNQAIGAANAAGQMGVGNAVSTGITQGIQSGLIKVK